MSVHFGILIKSEMRPACSQWQTPLYKSVWVISAQKNEVTCRNCIKSFSSKKPGGLSKGDLVIKRDALIENIIGNSNSINFKVGNKTLGPQADYIRSLRAEVKTALAELKAVENVLLRAHDI